jgi:hypothetical protein
MRLAAIVAAVVLLLAACSSSSADPADVALGFATLEGDREGMFTNGLRRDLGWAAEDVYVSPDGQCAVVVLTFEGGTDGLLMVLASSDHFSVSDLYGEVYQDHPEWIEEIEGVAGIEAWIPMGNMFPDALKLDDYRAGLVTFRPKCQDAFD